jgi:predicted transcriptional regulator
MKREKYRSRVEIIVDVLRAIEDERGDQRLTHIQSRANIPYTRLVSLLEELERIEFISRRGEEEKKVYMVTQKGRKYIKEYEKFRKLSQAFGLKV